MKLYGVLGRGLVMGMAVALGAVSLGAAAATYRMEVDATERCGTLEPFWASQIIHPTEWLRQKEGEEFLRLLAESGAARDYVRIYNQPEYAIRVAADGTISYDWSHFDAMADKILAVGNKLKVAFFGMPVELAKYPKSSIYRAATKSRVCTSPPRDYRDWQALCADFAAHIIARYGLETASSWTLRCWNEPDLGFWHNRDLPEYLKLYDYFAAGIKGVSRELKIGGPALASTSTYQKPEKFTFFLDHVTSGTNHVTGERGSPIDFIAVHTYGGSGGGGGPGRDFPAVDYLLEQQLRYAEMRERYPTLRGMPIHVEEWGVSSGGTRGVQKNPKAVVRNHEYGAAFLANWVARHVELRQERDPGIASFTFCSSGYEKPRESDFLGYRTFRTVNGIDKPILNGYRLLSRMPGGLLASRLEPQSAGVKGFATYAQDEVLRVLVVNYQSEEIENEGEAVALKLSVKPPWSADTPLKQNHWRIDRTHSNAYTLFKEMGLPDEMTTAELDDLKKRMGLELLQPESDLTAAALTEIGFTLPCNGVSLLEWRRAVSSK